MARRASSSNQGTKRYSIRASGNLFGRTSGKIMKPRGVLGRVVGSDNPDAKFGAVENGVRIRRR